jgi:rhodanese-related sulfurtransferase
MSVRTITPTELDELCRRGQSVELIDVRTPAEYREVHAEFARSVPLDLLDPRAVMEARNGSGHEPLYTICRSGSRGRQACEKFLASGYANLVNVEGGTLAWEQAGLPVVRGKKTISLERQVRIAAGSLVLLGTALGAFVHPAFLGLAAFVGAGLVFAGATDTCGLGMLLARMPWNQAGGAATCAG